ncbi:MAG: DUF4280 domain-containing protein [Myxococcales bacterium]|nr:DUF4280 domain-containing protein [Myxococcales bacterium]
MLTCSMGLAPSVFVATPKPGMLMVLGTMHGATIDQITPANVPPFVMCRSQANPAVAAATAAAMGTPTPAPCIPNIVSPWAPPAATPTQSSLPTATVNSRCNCAFGGSISVANPVLGPAQTT